MPEPPRLKRTTAVAGDPGAWAALTLARRGHKDRCAAGPGGVPGPCASAERQLMGSMGEVPHRNLQKRVLVLLSNSARAGGVPQPTPPGQPPSSFDALLAWWKKTSDVGRQRPVARDLGAAGKSED